MIEIKTPARLHLGLLDINGGLGRIYGSIGVAIQRPNVLLEAEPAEDLIVEGLEPERVSGFARCFLEHYPGMPGARLFLKAKIPSHVGLGSGTQLALAVGSALAHLGGLDLSLQEIALAMGRGVHSGIGIAAFQSGGFVLDGGHPIACPNEPGSSANSPTIRQGVQNVPPVLFRCPVPEDWCFVVVVPEVQAGISGERETSAFKNLPRAPQPIVERISWLVLMKLLPSLVEKDITGFGQALTEIQKLVGDCFAAVQGGRFANTLSSRLIVKLIEWGAFGAGQSSWGPVVYGLVKGEERALELAKIVDAFLACNDGGHVFAAQVDNSGACIKYGQN